MQKRTMTKVFCENCGIEFEKADSEVKRNFQLKRRNFCSRRCCGKKNYINLPKGGGNKIPPPPRRDEYQGFREFIRRAKNRNAEKGTPYDIDLDYLVNVWKLQEGKCAYTGIQMVLPHGVRKGTRFTASLDRIDSSKGYLKGNVQYVLAPINYMKNTMSHEETIELLNLIKSQ